MHNYFRKNLLSFLTIILIFALILLCGFLYYFYTKKISGLTEEKNTLNQQYLETKQGLDAANKSLEEKNAEIVNLQQSRNNAVRNDVAANAQTNSTTTSNQQSSIYSRVNGSEVFNNRIVNALNLLAAQDGEHFQIVASQVESINEYNDYGGYQEKRNIYIGADENPAITGSIISHEAQHVYNVYVDKIYSYHTKEQELPCYQAELLAAQRLGAPAFFIASVQSSIDYWQAQ